jgi:hypothetical protein
LPGIHEERAQRDDANANAPARHAPFRLIGHGTSFVTITLPAMIQDAPGGRQWVFWMN